MVDTVYELHINYCFPGRGLFILKILVTNEEGLKVLPMDTNVSKYKFKNTISLDSNIYDLHEDSKDGYQYNKRSDVFYIQQNYITVSPIVLRNTCDNDLENYQSWFDTLQHESAQ